MSERIKISAQVLWQTHHERKAAISLKNFACALAANRHLHDVLHFTDAKSVARERFALQLDAEQRQTIHLLYLRRGRAPNFGEDGSNVFCCFFKHIDVIAKNFHCHIALHSSDQLVSAQLNGLLDFDTRADDLFDRSVHLLDQLRFRFFRIWPFLLRFQDDEFIALIRRHWISRNFCCSQSPECELNFRKTDQSFLKRFLHFYRLIHSRTDDAVNFESEVAFIERRNEFAAEPREQGEAKSQHDYGAAQDKSAFPQCSIEQRHIKAFRCSP